MYTILRFIAFVKCTFLLIILSNISIFILFSFSSTSMKSLKILYNFKDNNSNITSNDVKGLLYWCWIKKYFSQKIFWLLIPFNVWLSCQFYNLLFAYCKSFFLKKTQAGHFLESFFVERFPDTFLNDLAFVSPLFISLLDSTSE